MRERGLTRSAAYVVLVQMAALHSRSGRADDVELARKLQKQLNGTARKPAPKRRSPPRPAAAARPAKKAAKKQPQRRRGAGAGAGGVWGVGDEVLVRDRETWYSAKIIGQKSEPDGPKYQIHFKNWKSRFDKCECSSGLPQPFATWSCDVRPLPPTGVRPGEEADEMRPVEDEEASVEADANEGNYEVESVVGKREVAGGGLEYQVHWRCRPRAPCFVLTRAVRRCTGAATARRTERGSRLR